MEIIDSYLRVEKIRFDEKLEYQIKLEADGDYLVPRFLLQPMVENAIKHGISKLTHNGNISINVIALNGHLEISVHDNGNDFPADMIAGYGLTSIYEKLNLLFPESYEVNLINGEDKQIKIILRKLLKNAPTVQV